MIGIVCSGLRGISGAARAVFGGSANAARAVSETAIGAVSAPVAQLLAMAHGASGQMIVNSAGQMLQAPTAAVATAASSASSGGGLGSLYVPPSGASAGGSAGASAPMPAQHSPPVTEAMMAGALPMQGTALPLMPQGVMRIG